MTTNTETDAPTAKTDEPEPGVRVIAGRRYLSPERLALIINRSTRTLHRWREKRIGPPYNELLQAYPEDGVGEWAKANDRQAVPQQKRRRKLGSGGDGATTTA